MSKSSASMTHRAEIHSHSTASDGTHTPARVAQLCHQKGVEIWSLTDHDNCYGCAEARKAAESFGITFIPGIEISAFWGTSVHVLGYGMAPDGEVIEDYSRKRIESRRERMHAMIDRLDELGVEMTMEQVEACAESTVLGRPHLAAALAKTGQVNDVQDAFDRWLHTGGPAHVVTEWPGVTDAISLIQRAGGVAVIAHPGQYDLDDAVEEWADAGLDGIEVVHPSHDRADSRRYRKLADQFGLLKTASSDFHGNRARSAYFGRVPFPNDWLEAFLDAVDVEA